MNIAIDARAAQWYTGTGMGTYATGLIAGLAEINNRNIHVILPNGEYSPADAAAVAEIKTEENKDFWRLVQEDPIAPKENWDVLHNLHNGFGLPQVSSCPTVVTIHDLIPLIMPEYCGSPYREIFQEKIEGIAQNADRIIAASHSTKRDIIRLLRIPPQKITVIYQGISPIYHRLNKEAVKRGLVKNYGIEEDFILYVGGFNPRKNLTALVEAFCLIQEEIPWNLVIAGKEGKRSAEIKELAKKQGETGRIIFTGYLPTKDLTLFYNGAKTFVYPSLYEGFGLPPLEAAACGTAVIVGNTSSLPEVMADKALYVNPLRSEELARAILSLYRYEDQRLTLAREAFSHSRLFSQQIAARKTMALYENLCR
ncbi:MAG: glycosyltransferase family 1 protein [Bacillota bacterium]|nr:glycosyltransferase family 1 protein [Bacillota bacterium]